MPLPVPPATPVPKSAKIIAQANVLLRRGIKVRQGNTMYEAGIGSEWMEAYVIVAERCDRKRRYRIWGYPYEASPNIVALVGGFFDHPDWPLKKSLEKPSSMHAVAQNEFKYVNSVGYFMIFHHAAVELHAEVEITHPVLANQMSRKFPRNLENLSFTFAQNVCKCALPRNKC